MKTSYFCNGACKVKVYNITCESSRHTYTLHGILGKMGFLLPESMNANIPKMVVLGDIKSHQIQYIV